MLQAIFLVVLLMMIFISLKGIRNPGFALALVWSTYALEQFLQHSHSFFVSNGRLINYGVVCIAIAGVMYSLNSGTMKRIRFTRAHVWWGCLLGLATISILWSINREISIKKYQLAVPYIFGFCVIAPFCAFNKSQIDKAIQASVFFGGLILFGMLFCNFGSRAIVLAVERGGRTIEGNPLAVATYGGYVAICAVFSIYSHKGNFLLKLLKFSIIGLALYIIVRSGSRGQLIAMVIACFIWVPLTAQVALKRSTFLAVITAALLILGGIYFVGSQEELSWRWSSNRLQADQAGRLGMAKEIILQNFEAGPWAWLVGLGSSASFPILKTYPHVVPAEILAEEGVVGFGLFVGFLLAVLSVGFRVMKIATLDNTSRVNMGAMLTMFTFQLALCLKQGSFLGSPGLFCIGLCVALSAERTLATQSPYQQFVYPSAPRQPMIRPYQ